MVKMVTSLRGGISPFLVLLGLFAVSATAKLHGDVPLNYTHVCNSERFAGLGLDMSQFTHCDKSLPYHVRAKHLVQMMTLSEKVQQLGDKSSGVPRLGLPPYWWWSEALHGIANTGPGTVFNDEVPGATSFPTVILSAASFNKTLWNTIGQVVSTEGRAMFNLGTAGLTYWSPNINVVRDPRWGRTLETPGEDPLVVGTWAAKYVRGLQDIEGTENTTDLNSRPLKVSACCKHYTAYDLDKWMGIDRFHFDARVTAQDMMETFQVPFKMCVEEGDVSSVMCSFNEVNGIPTCADPVLLKDTIRGKWNLHGYIVSDCDSIEVIVDHEKWLKDTPEDAASQVLRAGLDLDCGDFYSKGLGGAVLQGQVSESLIDRALINNYAVLMRVGFFDGIPSLASLGKSDVCSKDHIELAVEAAREGIVLLKNDNQTLPLSPDKYKNLAVIGPHANATTAMIGNYAGIPCSYVSPLDGFSAYGNVTYEMGCGEVACRNDTLIFRAMQAAKDADATILLVGLDLSVEAEWVDRKDLLLPGYQSQLVTQVSQIAQGPVILVIMSGGCIDVDFAKNNPKIQAILWAGYPGEGGGRAIADGIFGKYNPAGRLPLTWYKNDYINIPMTSMQLRPDDAMGYPGRTYRFFNGSTVYPFGYGLSYTQFEYEVTPSKENIISVDLKINKNQICRRVNFTDESYNQYHCPAVVLDDLQCGGKLEFTVTVKNVGESDGDEVVMAYWKPPEGIVGTPLKKLIGFERVSVPAGGSRDAKFIFDACESLATVDAVGYRILHDGIHTIMFGDGMAYGHVSVSFTRE